MPGIVKRYYFDPSDSKWKRPEAVLDPTPSGQIYFGAFHSPEDASSWSSFETELGYSLAMRRIYNPGAIGGTWSQHDTTTRGHWYSFKGDISTMGSGGYDSALTTWLNSVPGSHLLYLTWQHEPENPSKAIVAAEFRTGAQHFYTHVKSIRPQTTVVMPVFMDWTHNPASGRNPLDWYPGDNYTDIIGVDTYNTYLWEPAGSPATWENIPITGRANPMVGFRNFVNFAAAHDKPWAIGEVATREHQSDSPATQATLNSYKARWITDLGDYAAQNGCTALLWFNILKSGDTTADILLTSSQGSITAFGNILAEYGRSL